MFDLAFEGLMELSNLESQIFEGFTKFKDTITQSNCTNIGNMHGFTINLGLLTEYVRDAIKAMKKVIQKYQQQNQYLKSIIHQNGLDYLIKDQQYIANHDLRELNLKIHEHIIQKQIAYKIRNEGKEEERSMKKKKQSQNGRKYQYFPKEEKNLKKRQINQKDAEQTAKFVKNYLKDKIQWNFGDREGVNKATLLSIFRRWNQSLPSDEKLENPNFSQVQTALTNDLKHLFPYLTHNHRKFKGLKFKSGYCDLNFKSSKAQAGSSGDLEDDYSESPALTFFDEEDKIDLN